MLRLLACSAIFALASGAGAAVPTMPQEYSAVVLLRMPYIPLKMPLHVLTSQTTQRIEYYDGLEVDTISKAGAYKYTFNNSERVCIYAPPSAGPADSDHLQASSWPQSHFLPDLSQYNDEGDTVIDGMSCRKFSQSAKHGTTGTMDDHNVFYWDVVLDKPLRWHMHSRATPWGSHTDEYILDFISFQAGPPSDTAFALPRLCSERPVESDVSVRMDSFLRAASALSAPNALLTTDLPFASFLAEHGKAYAPEEHTLREIIYSKNVALVNELNQKHAGQTTFKVNKFMDMTKGEIMRFRGGKSKSSTRSERRSMEQQKYVHVYETVASRQLPQEFDWRSEKPGVIGPVKDQAMCGSCWTYGTTEPIESALAILAKKDLVLLPEQFVLDCTWTNHTGASGGNLGCDGGDSDIGALEIVRKFGGVLPTAEAYGSYLATNGYCKDIRLMDVGAKILGWVDLKERDAQGMMQALVSHGPISVGIQVPDEMLYYDSGVLNVDSCRYNTSQIDHAVVLAGYGTLKGSDYYLIRNSWSTYWGDLGYIKISRGQNDCCVSCQAGYPEIALGESVQANVIV